MQGLQLFVVCRQRRRPDVARAQVQSRRITSSWICRIRPFVDLICSRCSPISVALASVVSLTTSLDAQDLALRCGPECVAEGHAEEKVNSPRIESSRWTLSLFASKTSCRACSADQSARRSRPLAPCRWSRRLRYCDTLEVNHAVRIMLAGRGNACSRVLYADDFNSSQPPTTAELMAKH